jgi:hypothetical protein
VLTNRECGILAADKAVELFGREYLKENKENMCLARCDFGDEFMVFFGIKTTTDTPKLKPNKKGWTVYAEIYVNKETGSIYVKDYQTECEVI